MFTYLESSMKRVAIPVKTDELCSYGCGSIAKFKNGSGNLMCQDRSNKCTAIKIKNSKGGKKSYLSGKRKSSSHVYMNLPQETKDRMAWNRNVFSADFSYDGKGSHKKVLIQERGNVCESCGLSEWLNKPIILELEHCDGNNRNNAKENLKLLCPNCHSLTNTWRGRNINSGKIKVTDDELKVALQKNKNIRQALLSVGLAAKGSNYVRCYELLAELGGVVKLENTSDLSSDASACGFESRHPYQY